MKLIFDSNVFDDFISGKINIHLLDGDEIEVFITHIQVGEINKCPDEVKRAGLFNIVTTIRPKKLLTESAICDVSVCDEAKVSDGKLLEELRIGNPKHNEDALIGETAIKNNLILISNDKAFRERVKRLGGESLSVEELLQRMQKQK